MKPFFPLLFLSILLASCAPSVVPGSQTDPAQQRHITELESQLESQRHVNDRWQAGMAQYFQSPEGANPDQAMQQLAEYFHLD